MNNRVKEAFDCVHAEEKLKENTKAFVHQTLSERRPRRRIPYKPLAAVIACLLLVIAGWQGYAAYFTPVSAICVDVNPSIELEVNRFDTVISVAAYNEDGADVITAVNLRFLNYQKALEQMFQDQSMSKYLSPNQRVEITVYGTNAEKNQELLETLTASTASYGNFHCAAGDAEEVAAAHSAGLSCGKYRAFLELQSLDPNVTAEDVKDLTMRQIRDQIAALSGDSDTPAPDNRTESGNTEHGCGNGGGAGKGYGAGRGNGAGNGNGTGHGHGAGAGNGYRHGRGAGWHTE